MRFEHILKELPAALKGDPTPPVTILFVVDDDDFTAGKVHDYRTTTLQQTLRDAGHKVEILRRSASDARTFLDPERLAKYQQLWFFLLSTDPRDQLSPPEVDALWEWMDRGNGVLITGDHADCRQESVGGALKVTARGLGSPIGRLVPRAGLLRVWDERPGAQRSCDNNDSTTTGAPAEEKDRIPQRLLLPEPAHPIFNNGAHYLPDHPHEGLVRTDVTIEQWFRPVPDPPPVFQPPRIIARGIDWWRGRTFALMAAWDGDLVGDGCGRILADASWHHYVEYNLAQIQDPERAKILQLYRNQAEYLLPRQRRAATIAGALAALLRTPAAVEYELTDPRALGEFALKELSRTLSGLLYEELRDALRHDVAPGAVDLEYLRDPGIEAHLVGVQVRLLRHALTEGRAHDLAALKAELLGAHVLRDALGNYELELNAKTLSLKDLRDSIL